MNFKSFRNHEDFAVARGLIIFRQMFKIESVGAYTLILGRGDNINGREKISVAIVPNAKNLEFPIQNITLVGAFQ